MFFGSSTRCRATNWNLTVAVYRPAAKPSRQSSCFQHQLARLQGFMHQKHPGGAIAARNPNSTTVSQTVRRKSEAVPMAPAFKNVSRRLVRQSKLTLRCHIGARYPDNQGLSPSQPPTRTTEEPSSSRKVPRANQQSMIVHLQRMPQVHRKPTAQYLLRLRNSKRAAVRTATHPAFRDREKEKSPRTQHPRDLLQQNKRSITPIHLAKTRNRIYGPEALSQRE